jgi:hypothetical protein
VNDFLDAVLTVFDKWKLGAAPAQKDKTDYNRYRSYFAPARYYPNGYVNQLYPPFVNSHPISGPRMRAAASVTMYPTMKDTLRFQQNREDLQKKSRATITR